MNERRDGGTQAAPRSHAERRAGSGEGEGGGEREREGRGREAVGRPAGRPRGNKKKFIEPPVTCCVPVT